MVLELKMEYLYRTFHSEMAKVNGVSWRDTHYFYIKYKSSDIKIENNFSFLLVISKYQCAPLEKNIFHQQGKITSISGWLK